MTLDDALRALNDAAYAAARAANRSRDYRIERLRALARETDKLVDEVHP